MEDLKEELEQNEMDVISYIDIFTSSLSVLGAGSIIFCAACRCRAFSSEIQPIFHLSLSDLCASLCLLISALLYGQQTVLPISTLCAYLAALTSALYTTTFFFTVLYSAEVYRRMKHRSTTTSQSRQKGIAESDISWRHVGTVLIWLVPAVLSCVIVSIPDPVVQVTLPTEHTMDQHCRSCLPLFHYNENVCWDDDAYVKNWHIVGKYLFLIPLTMAIMANFVFYGLALSAYRENHKTRGVLTYHQYQEEKYIRNKAILYQTVFFLCWLPSLVLGFISLVPSFQMKNYFWLYILQASTAPLQGALNCVIYGWKRQGFKQALYETTPLNGDAAIPDYSNFSL